MYVSTQNRIYIKRQSLVLNLSEVTVMVIRLLLVVKARYLGSRFRVNMIYSVIPNTFINEDPESQGSALSVKNRNDFQFG